MTDVSDIAAFLAARLDEDEAAAKAWLPFGNPDAITREHIARHDPARALREVGAGRAILAEHETRTRGEGHDGRPRCHVCTAIADNRPRRFTAPCPTLRALASVYSTHPDYREEWAP